jgi:hypothetical protein
VAGPFQRHCCVTEAACQARCTFEARCNCCPAEEHCLAEDSPSSWTGAGEGAGDTVQGWKGEGPGAVAVLEPLEGAAHLCRLKALLRVVDVAVEELTGCSSHLNTVDSLDIPDIQVEYCWAFHTCRGNLRALDHRLDGVRNVHSLNPAVRHREA